MKKIILVLAFFSIINFVFAEEKPLARYQHEHMNTILTNEKVQMIVDSLNPVLAKYLDLERFPGRLASFEIDDPAPFVDTSVAYLTMVITDGENKSFTVNIPLSKAISGNEFVDYHIEIDKEQIAAKGAVCETLAGCTGCNKRRNWFLGAVKGCDCNSSPEQKCKFTSADEGFWDFIVKLVTVTGAVVTIILALD